MKHAEFEFYNGPKGKVIVKVIIRGYASKTYQKAHPAAALYALYSATNWSHVRNVALDPGPRVSNDKWLSYYRRLCRRVTKVLLAHGLK